MSYISEHIPIIIAQNLGFFVFTAITITVIGFTDAKLKLSDAFLLLGLFLMTISSQRNLYLLLPLGGIVIVKMVNEFILKNLKLDSVEYQKTNKVFWILALIVVLGISIYNFISKINVDYIDSKEIPVKATEWIKNNLDLDNIKLYNDYDFGSYLLLKGIPVFIDSRCDLYTPEFNKDVYVFKDYMDAFNARITYKNLFEKYNITHAIVYKNSIDGLYLSEYDNTEVLYDDGDFVIYEYK